MKRSEAHDLYDNIAIEIMKTVRSNEKMKWVHHFSVETINATEWNLMSKTSKNDPPQFKIAALQISDAGVFLDVYELPTKSNSFCNFQVKNKDFPWAEMPKIEDLTRWLTENIREQGHLI
jgi:hypothetical protein